MKFLSQMDVIEIHDLVISRNELQGMAGDKSLEAVIARIGNRMSFGMINDEFDLAACYACFLAVGHVFNDANKRTAFACMDVCLSLNDIELIYDHQEVGDLVVKVAQGIVDEIELSAWLRAQSSN
ncbi:MAG: type II toxin-antitoxin system death-on-curing family toxin [Gammaproteobacteria bacterium]|nr:type II toxin-antitoxin system death-on-curing family toxin [Gammaproteobacteria bacterium]